MDDSTDVLMEPPDVDNGSCRLLGPVALGVQALMGTLVVGALVFKRYRESNRRPWKVWLCDVSKQIIGQAFVHAFNLLVSDLFAVHGGQNACSGYFLNISIDTTIGVLIIYGFMKLFHWLLVVKLNKHRFRSGHYGNPPSIISWLLQLAVYVLVLTLMKLLVVASLAIFPFIFNVSDFLLDEMSPNAQVIVSMCIWPLIMNVMQFWLIDSLIKSKIPLDDKGFRAHTSLEDFDVGDDDDDDDDENRGFLRKPDSDDEEEVDADTGDASRSLEEGRRRDDSKDGDGSGNNGYTIANSHNTTNTTSRSRNSSRSSNTRSSHEHIPLKHLSLQTTNLRHRIVTQNLASQVVY
ncbi:hypothetical protein E3P99_02231 [Wallemia hederae]|uniref:Vacuolar membrane protein n=1 Tax=Wallemia hederae TaxID=1540922 RepID=A0A4V6TMD2_9BASI|nr:hypothetical protein E3P99_02231 [Wallemia hederae]